MKAPFPYFGGKSSVAGEVWGALGDVDHYIEPFFGSGAVLLLRPGYRPGMTETVCDADGHVCNVWRSMKFDSAETAKWCDWPVNHADLIARKRRLNLETEGLLDRLCADEEYFDAKLAGYWIWAASCWIGHGLICPNQRPHIGTGGKGIHAKGKRPHVCNGGMGVHAKGKRPHVCNGGKGVHAKGANGRIYEWFGELAERLRYVRVICGDWSRVCGGNWQDNIGVCGMFFDPPYGHSANRDDRLYSTDSLDVADDVRAWCLERGASEQYRIVLAGYYEEHESLLDSGWDVKRWSAKGGYAGLGNNNGKANRHREALFFSPHCVNSRLPLFDIS